MKVKLHTSDGDIVVALHEADAPVTVANFLEYVRSGFYDGTLFHRVIDGFMVQGGGFEPGMRQKPTRPPIENEAGNGRQNLIGTVAMARTSDPHSASSQFFLNAGDNGFLDFKSESQDGWGYCVFGEVVDGMDTLNKITDTPTASRAGHHDVPTEDILLERAEVLED